MAPNNIEGKWKAVRLNMHAIFNTVIHQALHCFLCICSESVANFSEMKSKTHADLSQIRHLLCNITFKKLA